MTRYNTPNRHTPDGHLPAALPLLVPPSDVFPPGASSRMHGASIRLRSFVLALAATALAGCAVGPNYHTPDEHPPADFAAVHGQSAVASRATSEAPQATVVDFSTWWSALHDP